MAAGTLTMEEKKALEQRKTLLGIQRDMLEGNFPEGFEKHNIENDREFRAVLKNHYLFSDADIAALKVTNVQQALTTDMGRLQISPKAREAIVSELINIEMQLTPTFAEKCVTHAKQLVTELKATAGQDKKEISVLGGLEQFIDQLALAFKANKVGDLHPFIASTEHKVSEIQGRVSEYKEQIETLKIKQGILEGNFPEGFEKHDITNDQEFRAVLEKHYGFTPADIAALKVANVQTALTTDMGRAHMDPKVRAAIDEQIEKTTARMKKWEKLGQAFAMLKTVVEFICGNKLKSSPTMPLHTPHKPEEKQPPASERKLDTI